MAPLLIFDGDCGFCTASVNVLRRWIRPECDIAPWQQTDLAALGLSPRECQEAVQFVTGDGRILDGSRAVMATLRTARQPWPNVAALGSTPPVAWLADRVYRWIAAHRHKLPGSTPACAAAPAPMNAAS